MPRFGPIKRQDLIRFLRQVGFEGPYSGGRHQFMVVEISWQGFYVKLISSEMHGKSCNVRLVTVRLKMAFWVDYDREADVLYISFRRPQQATDTKTTDEGILLRYHGKELVGITVLEASTRTQGLPTAREEEHL